MGKLLVCDFFTNFTKIKLADNIVKRCQGYKINGIKCYSSNPNHFSRTILKVSQCYNSPLQVLHLAPDVLMRGVFSLIKQPLVSLKMSLSSATNGLPYEVKKSFKYSTLLTLQGFE